MGDMGEMMRQAAAEDPRIRWLKPLVIGLSIVFFGGLLLLVVLIATGAHLKRTPAPVAPPTAIADRSITLPKNSRVTDVLASGNRILLRVRLADGSERLYALDGASLQPLGSVTIQVEK